MIKPYLYTFLQVILVVQKLWKLVKLRYKLSQEVAAHIKVWMKVDTYSIVLRWSGLNSFCEHSKPQWRSSGFQFSRTLSHYSSFDVETDRLHDKSFKSFGEQRSVTSNQTVTASHELVSIRRRAPQHRVQTNGASSIRTSTSSPCISRQNSVMSRWISIKVQCSRVLEMHFRLKCRG